jgi:hypothetical protein
MDHRPFHGRTIPADAGWPGHSETTTHRPRVLDRCESSTNPTQRSAEVATRSSSAIREDRRTLAFQDPKRARGDGPTGVRSKLRLCGRPDLGELHDQESCDRGSCYTA